MPTIAEHGSVASSTLSRAPLLTSTVAAAGTELRKRPIVIAIGAAAAACAVLGAAAVERGQLRGENPVLAGFTIFAGLSFITAGLVASSRRRERWTGALMVGAGFALFAGTLINANRSLPFTIGLAVALIPTAVLANLVSRSRTAGSIALGTRHRGRGLSERARGSNRDAHVHAIEAVGGCPCPHNLLFARDDMSVHMRLMSIERYLGLAAAVAVIVVLAQRWSLASPPLRRALFPILISGGIAMGLVAATWVSTSLPYTDASVKLQSAERLAFGVVPIAYLIGLFRARMSRVGVSDLIVELGRGLEPGQVRDAIARSLRDPSLEIAYWIRDPDEFVDVNGSPVSVVPTAERSVTIIERHGDTVAALIHDPALSEDPALLDAVSSAAGLALENERLLVELRAQLEEVRDSRARIVEAGVAEQRRLERNLHDGAQQRLVTLSSICGWPRKRCTTTRVQQR